MTYSVTHPENLKIGHEKLRETLIINLEEELPELYNVLPVPYFLLIL